MSKVGVGVIWGMLPINWAAKVQDDALRVSIIEDAVMRIYRDLAECFSERNVFPLTKGNVQIIPFEQNYVRITGAKYHGQNLPVFRNGNMLEIPIAIAGEASKDDYFEIVLTQVPRFKTENNTAVIDLDFRVKILLKHAIILSLYELEENSEDNENYRHWRNRYEDEKQKVKTALSCVPFADQRYENAATGASGIPNFEM